MPNKFGETYQDRLMERAADAGIYEMLLRTWLEKWDTIEEWILNGLVAEDIETLAEETRKQLDYHKKEESK